MNRLMRLLSWVALAFVSACGGGGGGGGTPGLGSPPTAAVADVVIVLASDSIANTGTDPVSATITAVDANRRGVKGVSLAISVDSNAVLTTTSSTTNDNGIVNATIGIGSDRSPRNITITAVAQGVTKTAVLRVVTDSGTRPTAEDLSLTLSAPSVTNGGTSTITASVTAVDRNRNVVAGIPVTFAVDSGATVAPVGTVTNPQGVLTAAVGIGADRSNRVITVTATSGTLVRTASFAVIGARLGASASPLIIAGSRGNVIEYTLVDLSSAPMVGQSISVSGAGLTTATGRTDLNGKFRYTFDAPATPGTLEVLAIAAGVQDTQRITLSPASSSIAPANEMPMSATVTPTPSVVSVNTRGSNANQVELRALFIGANNRPIQGMRARFDLAGNLTSTDGTISWVGPYAYSDENGIARATFTPGVRPSPTNGITIRMCYDIVDFGSGPGGACDQVPRFHTSTLTVTLEALAVSIGTNNEIKQGINNLTYIKEYVVMVVDSSGAAKADAQIVPSVDLTRYRKGFYRWNGRLWTLEPVSLGGGVITPPGLTLDASEHYVWTGSAWQQDPLATGAPGCPNEDINRNGVREAGTVVTGAQAPELASRREDLNWSGDLDPRKSLVAIKMVGSPKTDVNGIAIVQIEYPESVASWIDYVITVTASGVSGTEARALYAGTLPFAATDVTSEAIVPAFQTSPFGTGSTCTDTR